MTSSTQPARTSASPAPASWGLWAAAGAAEAPWLLFLLSGKAPGGGATLLLSRLAAAGLVFLACPPWPPESGRSGRAWSLPLSALALLLPGWGWLLWALVRPAAGASLDAAPADALAEELLDEEEPDWQESSPQSESRRLLEAADVAPAADLLLGRDPALKRGAIETLAKVRTPEAISWLLGARSDPDPEVRFFATSALTNLKRDYEAKRRAAETELFKRPADASLRLALKRLLLEYARSGLLDPKSRQSLLEGARQGLAALSRQRPEALSLLYEVERELDPTAALAVLDRLIASSGRESLPWIQEKCAALFRLGAHSQVLELMTRHGPEILATPPDPLGAGERANWKSAALWWTRG